MFASNREGDLCFEVCQRWQVAWNNTDESSSSKKFLITWDNIPSKLAANVGRFSDTTYPIKKKKGEKLARSPSLLLLLLLSLSAWPCLCPA